jgi:hypothetical protein
MLQEEAAGGQAACKGLCVFQRAMAATGAVSDLITLRRYFSDTLEAMIAEAKSEGRHESGPINLQATAVHIAHRDPIHREESTGERRLPQPATCGLWLSRHRECEKEVTKGPLL